MITTDAAKMAEKICRQCGTTYMGGPYSQYCPSCRRSKMVVYKTRTCTLCGRTFTGCPSSRFCPECSAARTRDRDAKFRADGPVRKLGSTDRCVRCGKTYTVTGGLQKYCPKCAHDAYREVDRPKSRAWNHDHKDTYYPHKNSSRRPERHCVICGAPITAKTATITCDNPECKKARIRQRQKAADAKRRGKAPPADYVPTKETFFTQRAKDQ